MGSAQKPPQPPAQTPAPNTSPVSRRPRGVKCTECGLRSTSALIDKQGERAHDGQAFGRCKNAAACARRQRKAAANDAAQETA